MSNDDSPDPSEASDTPRLSRLEKRVEKLFDELAFEGRFDPKSRRYEPRSIWRSFYFSPMQILAWATAMNVLLFVGGTVYTGSRVASIQERYAEAAARIHEAEGKYTEAKLALESVELLEQTVKNRLEQIARDGEILKTQLTDESRNHSEQMQQLIDRSETQFDLLVRTRNDITEKMNGYLNETDEELKRVANSLTETLKTDVTVQGNTISLLQTEIDATKKDTEATGKDVEKLRTTVADQLKVIKEIKSQLQQELDRLVGQERVTLGHFWRGTDIWAKALVFGVPVLTLSVGFLSGRRRSNG